MHIRSIEMLLIDRAAASHLGALSKIVMHPTPLQPPILASFLMPCHVMTKKQKTKTKRAYFDRITHCTVK